MKDENDEMFNTDSTFMLFVLKKWDNLNLSNIEKTSVPPYFSKNALACKS